LKVGETTCKEIKFMISTIFGNFIFILFSARFYHKINIVTQKVSFLQVEFVLRVRKSARKIKKANKITFCADTLHAYTLTPR
jgi:hypothetical protein